LICPCLRKLFHRAAPHRARAPPTGRPHPPPAPCPLPAAITTGVARQSPGGTAATSVSPRLGFRAAAEASVPALPTGDAAVDGDQRLADDGGGAGVPVLGRWAQKGTRSPIRHLSDPPGIFPQHEGACDTGPGLAVVVIFFARGGRPVMAGSVDLDLSSSPSCESGDIVARENRAV
jgi:hypothetical protein